MIKFLMLLGLPWLTYTYLIYDTGESVTLDQDACNSTTTPNSETQSFSGTFEYVPQMFVYSHYFSINDPAGGSSVQVELHNLVVTTNGFTLTLSCFGDSTKRYHYIWYAFAGTRMTVLSPGLQTISKVLDNFTHPHTNTQATKGFVILTGLEYNDMVDFNMTVQSVTSTDVTVQIYSSNSNLKTLDYIVVVGTEESFTLTGPLHTGPSDSHTNLTSQPIKIPLNGLLLLPISGFSWNHQDYPRFLSNIDKSSSTVQYSVGTFGATTMVDIYFNQIWVYTEPYYPMFIQKYRFTRIYYRHPGFKQKIVILNQVFTQLGVYNLQIPDATTSVTIEINLEHQPQKKISGTLLKCNNCGTQNKYYIQYYYVSVYNFTKIVVYLVQQPNYNYNNLAISILNTGILITQETNLSDDHSTLVNLSFQ